MSFGSFVAAVYLLGFALWFAVDAPLDGPWRAIGALAVAITAAALAIALRRETGLERALAAVAALGFGSLALARLVDGREGTLAYLMLLLAPVVAILLAIPPRPRPNAAAGPAPRWTAWVASCGLVVALVAGWSGRAETASAPTDGALPASARVASIRWRPLEAAFEAARAEGRPVLVTVETSWCPYCSKMQTTTWSAPEVARELSDVLAVRLDAEDGSTGSTLASRYRVRGFPTQLLLASDGSLIARADGYQDARQFLAWFDGALDARPEQGG